MDAVEGITFVIARFDSPFEGMKFKCVIVINTSKGKKVFLTWFGCLFPYPLKEIEVPICLELALLYGVRNDLAIPLARKAFQLDPKDHYAHWLYAVALNLSGNEEEKKEGFRLAKKFIESHSIEQSCGNTYWFYMSHPPDDCLRHLSEYSLLAALLMDNGRAHVAKTILEKAKIGLSNLETNCQTFDKEEVKKFRKRISELEKSFQEGLAITGIGPQSVWRDGFGWRQMMEACGITKFPVSSEAEIACLVSTMQEAGATPQAIAFTKMLHESHETLAHMNDFREMGKVDLVEICTPVQNDPNVCDYAFSADGVLTFGDRWARWDQVRNMNIEKDPLYPSLIRKFPELSLWYLNQFETMLKLSNGGQRFIFNYLLLNGCRACERAGYARIAFDFDKSGGFAGTKLIDLIEEKPEPGKVSRNPEDERNRLIRNVVGFVQRGLYQEAYQATFKILELDNWSFSNKKESVWLCVFLGGFSKKAGHPERAKAAFNRAENLLKSLGYDLSDSLKGSYFSSQLREVWGHLEKEKYFKKSVPFYSYLHAEYLKSSK